MIYIPEIATLSEACFPSSFDTPMEELVSAEFYFQKLELGLAFRAESTTWSMCLPPLRLNYKKAYLLRISPKETDYANKLAGL